MSKSKKKDLCSIWTGNPPCKNEAEFEVFINEVYDKKGNATTSKFLQGFEVDYFDNDFIESSFDDLSFHFETEIKNFSYSESFSDAAIKEAKEKNIQSIKAIIILYGFSYDSKVKESNGMNFLGAFSYIKE